MEFRDPLNKILFIFLTEWGNHDVDMSWGDFVAYKYKDFGVVLRQDHSNGVVPTNIYVVVDEQKWLLTKIKYGI